MAVTVHVVTIMPTTIDRSTGLKIDKNATTTTINQMKNTVTEPRIVADSAIASSANNPTIKTYLEAEAALGFTLTHLSQGMCVTTKVV